MSDERDEQGPLVRSELWKQLDAVFGRMPDEKLRRPVRLKRKNLVEALSGEFQVFVPLWPVERGSGNKN